MILSMAQCSDVLLKRLQILEIENRGKMPNPQTTNYAEMSEPELYQACGSDATKWAAAFIQCTDWEGDHEIMETWFASAMMAMLDAHRGLDEKAN